MTTLDALLKEVSRSFYLTLRILPAGIRPQMGLAYLLARATDTVADTSIVPVAERLQALAFLRERIQGRTSAAWSWNVGHKSQAAQSDSGTEAEGRLLERLEEILKHLDSLESADRDRARTVLDIITSGQELDLKRFGQADQRHLVALQTDADLHDYTYRVAGCVGEFWTRMCRAHLFPNDPLDETKLMSNAVRFGQGLQLINILRDVSADLRLGRCYLPLETLDRVHLKPTDLLDPSTEPKLRAAYNVWLHCAREHLAAGWDYTNTLPRRCRRVRLACAWPILIGQRTLTRLEQPGVLDASRRVKIARGEVRSILFRTLWAQFFPSIWRSLFEGVR